jgi:hypothetical protein
MGLLGKITHRWEDTLRMDPREIGWKAVEWIHLFRDRDLWPDVVHTVMSLWVPQMEGNFLSS